MYILNELFYGLRSVSFGSVAGPDGVPADITGNMMSIVSNWQSVFESSFEKEYLPRLLEYVRILEGSIEERNSPYSKRLLTDLHWTKRLYYLPFYKFESLATPSIQKKDITPIYPEIKRARRYLTMVAAGIDQGIRAGGPEKHASCDGIENPWEPYVFQIPNPLSRRLDALLSGKNRSNASLIYLTLAVVVVLDHLVNTEDSWAYGSRPGPLFRSIDGDGIQPLTGIDTRIDADALFKASLKKPSAG
jgi:hypothetical protein